jgi:hypothetical protein
MAHIIQGPHYEIPARELAQWLEEHGGPSWWSVDGDPLLTGRLSFPCPVDELAAELRAIGKPLLIQAPAGDGNAPGKILTADEFNNVVSSLQDNVPNAGSCPVWGNDRILSLCWKGLPHEWLLLEDSVTAKQIEADTIPAK